MEPFRYFYSIDGSDVHGPVTVDDLRKLIADRVIAPSSFLCREGETDWKPLDLEWIQGSAGAPGPPPFTPPLFVPTPSVGQGGYRVKESWADGPIPIIFNVLAVIVGVGAVILSTALTHPHEGSGTFSVSYALGAFIGASIVVLAIPHIIAKFFKGGVRTIVRCVGILGMSMLSVGGLITNVIASKNEKTRIDAVSAEYLQELSAKVKTSEVAEEACGSFDPGTLNSTADIDKLRDSIAKLRVTQMDVANFLGNYDDYCRDLMVKNNVTTLSINEFLAGSHESSQLSVVKAIWLAKVKLSDDHAARLDFLEKSWSEYTRKDGALLFNDDAGLNAFNQLTQPIRDDLKKIKDLAAQIKK